VNETRNVGQEVQAEIIKTVRRGQEVAVITIGTVKAWADSVRSAAPRPAELKLPELRLPELKLPFADRLPKPDELVGNAYELAGKLLASQRKLAENVRHATSPLRQGKNDTPGQNDTPGKIGSADK
jgi:hypothetical protein